MEVIGINGLVETAVSINAHLQAHFSLSKGDIVLSVREQFALVLLLEQQQQQLDRLTSQLLE